MKKNISFYIIAVLAIIVIFSSAQVCTFCGKEIEIKDADTVSNTTDNNVSSEDNNTKTDEENSFSTETELNNDKSVEEVSEESKADATETSEDVEQIALLLDNRFVLVIETMQGRSDEYCYARGNDPSYNEMCKYFTEQLKIPPEQQFIYWGQDESGGTYDNFIYSINSISKISNQDCTVMVFLMSHGSPDDVNGWPASIEFADGKGNEHGGEVRSYQEISELFNQIQCAMMTVTVSSCAMSDSVKPLTDNQAFPRAVMAPITMEEIFNYIFTDPEKVDEDKNGLVSFKDVYDFVHDTSMPINLGRYENMEYSDKYNIGNNVIFY